mgnify:FL=1
MDFEEELRKFVRSDISMRQMRESAHWRIEIWSGDHCLTGDACDVSKGGLGAVVEPNTVGQKRLVIGLEVTLHFLLDDEEAERVDRIPARIIWLRVSGNVWEIGFEFFDLSEKAGRHIDRYLLARIVTRHLDGDD